MEFGKSISYNPLYYKYIAAPISYIQLAVNRPEKSQMFPFLALFISFAILMNFSPLLSVTVAMFHFQFTNRYAKWHEHK